MHPDNYKHLNMVLITHASQQLLYKHLNKVLITNWSHIFGDKLLGITRSVGYGFQFWILIGFVRTTVIRSCLQTGISHKMESVDYVYF